MAKYSSLIKGTGARRRVPFELFGSSVEVDLRPLSPSESADVHIAAQAFVRAREAGEAKPGEPVYELGVLLHTVLRATLDPDDGHPFFDSVEQLLAAPFTTEILEWLAEQQKFVQQEGSPYGPEKTVEETLAICLEAAYAKEEGELTHFLERLRPAELLSLARSMGRLFVSSVTDRSGSGSPSPMASSTETKNGAEPVARKRKRSARA